MNWFSVQLFALAGWLADWLARKNDDERAKDFQTNGKKDVRVCLCAYIRLCSNFEDAVSFWHSYHKFFSGQRKKVTVIQFDQHNLTNRFSAFNNSISIIDVSSYFFHKSQSALLWMLLSRGKLTGREKKKTKHHPHQHYQQQQEHQQLQH